MSGRCRLLADCVAKVVLHWDQKFCGLQARLSRKDVRDLIASRKTQGDFGTRLRLYELSIASHFVFSRKNRCPATFDFCNVDIAELGLRIR